MGERFRHGNIFRFSEGERENTLRILFNAHKRYYRQSVSESLAHGRCTVPIMDVGAMGAGDERRWHRKKRRSG
jgi:hypothetical protein